MNELPMNDVVPNPDEASALPALAVKARGRLSRHFELDLDFSVAPGINILFGASGSGKSTVLRYVAGLATPDAGRISLGDRLLFDSASQVNIPAHRRNLGYVFQDLALFPHLTVQQNIAYGLAQLDEAERLRRIDAVLESFRIAHLRRQRPGNISGGEQQRVAMARALVTDPGVLLLDEPLTGLDLPTRSRLIDDLRAWNQAHRVPILYVTHAREEVFGLGESVIVLEQGRILAQGSPYEVLHRPRHELTAELAGVENLFDAVVVSLHEQEGTMTCQCRPSPNGPTAFAPPQLDAPLARSARPGSSVRLGIHAGDILVAAGRPVGLSARNLLPGKLKSLVRRDVTVVATIDCGIEFEVHLTPAAETNLGLRPGIDIWLVIKTYSCHLLR